jgi:diaminopimelate epimerase
MRFTKMHGIGNDYVYVDGFAERVADPAAVARAVSDRHVGIGSDGLILVLPPDTVDGADVRMRMFNADGSEAEMCGNGVRCVAKYAWDHGLTRSNPMRVQTGRGVLTLDLRLAGGKVDRVTVNMGEPILDLPQIPVDPAYVTPTGRPDVYRLELGDEGEPLEATFVSMGNPHAVVFVPSHLRVDLERLGPLVEHHAAFPRRVNAHFVQVVSRGEVVMRTWERGSGVTLACGTGACAVAVAGVLTGRTDRQVLAHLPGGDLSLDWRAADNCVYMTGAATEVFRGEIDLPAGG